MTKWVSPAEARLRLHDGGEIAFVDIRESGQSGEGHPLFATPIAYSRLEIEAKTVLPRKSVPILLIDEADGVAALAATRLQSCGYGHIEIVEGGMPAWAAAGYPVYKGVNVPSKLLGELAEARWQPRMVTADELKRWQETGKDFKLFDARPPAEYAKMRVPGAVCLPNGELAHRAHVAASDEHPVVITCAGRTRGIVGAIGLTLSGHRGPVHALENGTQGWALAGNELERGNRVADYPALTATAFEIARDRAMTLARRFDIPFVRASDIERFLQEPDRTTYLFDVRSAQETRDDPVRAAVHAPSGQLVQATDQWVAVRRSRLVLFDDTGLRAALAAFWLGQMGYDCAIALVDDAARKLVPTPAMPNACPPLARIDAVEAIARIREGALLFDLRGSLDYRREHVGAARWTIRPRIPRLAGSLRDRMVLLLADREDIAALAAIDVREAGAADVMVVEGGHEGMKRAGAAMAKTPASPTNEDAIDHLFFVHDRHDGNLEASKRYLAWETGLIDQMDETEAAEYRIYPAL